MTALQESQIITEALLSANAKYAVSQMVAEALLDGNPKLAYSQMVIECLMDPGPANLDCLQVVVEVLMDIPTNILPSGIASAEAFGSHFALGNATVALAAIPTGEVFGSPTLIAGNVNVVLQAINSQETFGSQSVVAGAVGILPTGIASSEVIGDPTVVVGGVDVNLTSIGSQEVIGNLWAVPGDVNIAPESITSEEVFGEQEVELDGQLTGIPSAEAFGTILVEAEVLSSISKGAARCMASDNIIKTQEAAVSAKPKIKTHKGAVQPTENKMSTFRYVHNPTWCEYDKGRSCVDGAILPTITVKNMKGKLPPKNRGVVAVSGLGSTRSS
jgi:hypothetical protein